MFVMAEAVEVREGGSVTSESAKQLKNMMKSADVMRVNLDEIWIDKAENVRELRSYTEDDVQDMVAAIEAFGGLMQPIGICRIADSARTEHKPFMLVWGYRRSLALLHLSEIDPKWKEGVMAQLVDETDTKGATRITQLIENLSRRELNPMEIAIGIEEALADKECDFNQKDLARIFGRSEANISQLRKLCRLPKEVQDMISTGKLPFSHARVILEFVPETQWKQAATKGSNMTFGAFEDEMRRTYGAETDGDEAAGEGGDAAKSSQKPAKMLRAGDLSNKYLPFAKEAAEKADASNKTFTAKDLANARLDALQTVLLNQETTFAKEIAPYLKKLEDDEAAEKAKADATKAEEKYFRGLVKRVEQILDTPVDPNNPQAARPTLTQAYSTAAQEAASLTADQKKELGFTLNADPSSLVQKIAATYAEIRKDREEARQKKEAKKKADEAAAAAEEAKKKAAGGEVTAPAA
jgi:ParB/RepB/Spo0J family partition protein